MRRMLATVGLLAAFASVSVADELKPIKIGAIYALTNAISYLGIPEERALKMRIEEINAKGGIDGRTFELVVYDTESDGTKAVQQFRRLVESDKVDVVFGPSSSGESMLVVDLANELEVPIIMHAGTDRVVVPPRSYGFNTPPSDRVAMAHILSTMQARGITSVAMLSSADGFGQSGKAALQELADQYGVKISTEQEFARQDPDMTVPMLKARESGAESVLVWSAPPAPAIAFRNAHDMDFDKPIFTSYAAVTGTLVRDAGVDAMSNVSISALRLVAPDSVPESDPAKPVVDGLVASYKAKYGEEPRHGAQHSFDAMLILEQAVATLDEPAPSRKAIRDAIEKVKVVGTNGRFEFSPENHGGLDLESGSFVMLKWADDRWQLTD